MSIEEPCYWERTLFFINNLSNNEEFKPIELKRFVYGDGDIKSTVGSYINFLEQVKYIERVSKGKYIRKKIIPDSLTTTKIYNYLYNNPLKDRLDKLEQIKNNLNGEL